MLLPIVRNYHLSQWCSCTLIDVGKVIDSVQNDKVASWYKRTRAVILAVQRQPNTNTIQIVDRIRELLPQYEAVMPAAVKLNVLYDRSQSIRASVNDVQITFFITLVWWYWSYFYFWAIFLPQ